MIAAFLTATIIAVVATGAALGLRKYVHALGGELTLSNDTAKLLGAGLFFPLVAFFSLASWNLATSSWAALALSALVACLLVLIWLDAETMILPDPLTIPLIWCGLLVNLQGTFTPLPDAVIGAVVGFSFPWLVDKSHHLMTGLRGMGMGDMKLFAALGAWLGWSMLPGIVLFALGLHLGGVMLSWTVNRVGRNRLWKRYLPFGPAIAVAGIVTAFSGWPALL